MAKQRHVRRVVWASVLVAIVLCSTAALASKAMHRAYVQSGPDPLTGTFYARCVPGGDRGTAGRTQIYRVRADGDEKVDVYDWYAPGGLVLGWSPIKGKVAVLSLMHEGPAEDWKTREAVRFSLGGERLASYTNEELVQLGASVTVDKPEGMRASIHVIGCEQVPGTNEYDFVIEIDAGKTLRFDITTGRPRPSKG